jgi:hypothetical protein
MNTGYAEEILDQDSDDGTMPGNVAELREHVVGHRIVSAEKVGGTFVITLDNGKRVELANTDDCCAYTELESFLLHPERVDHVITGVGTTDGYTTWHIYADMGDVLEMTVGWSAGNPFYYGYGFNIAVTETDGPVKVASFLGEIPALPAGEEAS